MGGSFHERMMHGTAYCRAIVFRINGRFAGLEPTLYISCISTYTQCTGYGIPVFHRALFSKSRIPASILQSLPSRAHGIRARGAGRATSWRASRFGAVRWMTRNALAPTSGAWPNASILLCKTSAAGSPAKTKPVQRILRYMRTLRCTCFTTATTPSSSKPASARTPRSLGAAPSTRIFWPTGNILPNRSHALPIASTSRATPSPVSARSSGRSSRSSATSSAARCRRRDCAPPSGNPSSRTTCAATAAPCTRAWASSPR